jgi:hypothetical protein
MEEVEQALQREAKALAPLLPFDELDILIVDEMGKNISGMGMDTKVIYRMLYITEPEPERPRIFVRDITPEPYGNAISIGLADFTTQRLVGKIDRWATYVNCITGLSIERGRIPMTFATDREALEAPWSPSTSSSLKGAAPRPSWNRPRQGRTWRLWAAWRRWTLRAICCLCERFT